MLSKVTKNKFIPPFHVPEQFITDNVQLFKVLLYLKIGDKKQLSNQVDHLISIPLGIVTQVKVSLELQSHR